VSKCLVGMQDGTIWMATVVPDATFTPTQVQEYLGDVRRLHKAALAIPRAEVKEMDTEAVRQAKWGSPKKE